MRSASLRPMRWLATLVSFGLMLGASVWIVAAHWPADGMPTLPLAAHLAAALTVTVEILTRALKIQASAIAVGYPLRFVTALRVCMGGDFAAAITPARTGAEPARFLILAESGMPYPGRVLVLFLELFLEMCSLALVCGVLALLFQGHGASTAPLLGVVGGYSVVVLAIGAAGFVLARRTGRVAPAWARRVGLNERRWRLVRRTFEGVRTSVLALRTARPGMMTAAFAGSVVHVICKVATLPVIVFLGDPAFALTMESLAPLVLWPLALFYGGAAVPAPGGGGVIEGAFATTLVNAIPAGIFAASLLWWRFYTFYLYLIVGGLVAGSVATRAMARRRHRARDRARTAPAHTASG